MFFVMLTMKLFEDWGMDKLNIKGLLNSLSVHFYKIGAITWSMTKKFYEFGQYYITAEIDVLM